MNITTTPLFEIKYNDDYYAIAGIYHSNSNAIALTKLANVNNIILVLEHEYIHVTLWNLGEKEACEKFDNIQDFICKKWY